MAWIPHHMCRGSECFILNAPQSLVLGHSSGRPWMNCRLMCLLIHAFSSRCTSLVMHGSFAHSAPWFTSNLRQLKTTGRPLGRLCKKSRLTVHTQMYSDHLHHDKTALSIAKSSHYSNLISTGKGNNREIFFSQLPTTASPNPPSRYFH